MTFRFKTNEDAAGQLAASHPALAIPNTDGLLLVIGQEQSQLRLTPRQMRAKAIEILERAEEKERQEEKAGSRTQMG